MCMSAIMSAADIQKKDLKNKVVNDADAINEHAVEGT